MPSTVPARATPTTPRMEGLVSTRLLSMLALLLLLLLLVLLQLAL